MNLRPSIVICGLYSLFFTADEGRLTQINADELDQFRLHGLWLTVDWILRPTMLRDLIGILDISLLIICVNLRPSIVICGLHSLFLTADEGR